MGKTDKIKHKKVKGEKMEYRSISLPTSLVEDLAILRECYEDTWFPVKEEEGPRKKRKAVSYEKVFERLLSKSGLGHVDSNVYKKFIEARKTRKKFPDVVKRSTGQILSDIFKRMETNGTSLIEEAIREQEKAEEELEELRAKRTEKRFVHPDGRWYRAEMGSTTWVPVNPDTGKWMKVQPVLDEGFELKDVEI